MLTKFKYWDTKMIGITRDQRLLLIEERSPLVTEFKEFRGKLIKDIACGLKFFNVLTADGELYLLSELDHGWHYRNPKESPLKGMRINIDLVEQIQCSDHYSIALTQAGQCYYWGLRFPSNQLTPTEMDLPSDICAKQVACCGCCFLALGMDNRAYGLGCNTERMLGDLPNMVPRAVKLSLNEDIKSAGFGGAHSIFLTFEGKLFHSGHATGGHFAPINTSVTFENVFGTPRGVTIGKGTNGKIYAWGHTKQGELKTPTETHLALPESLVMFLQELYTPMLMDIHEVSPQPEIENPITEVFNSSESSDIEFIFPNEGKSIRAHTSVLNLESEYMQAQTSAKWCKANTVIIRQNSYLEYYHYIYYLYTRQIRTNTMEEAFDLLSLATCFLEKSLEVACCEYILDKYFTIDTCIAIYECFVANSVVIYENEMAAYMAEHIGDLYEQPKFHNMSADLFKRFTLHYSKLTFQRNFEANLEYARECY